MKMFFPESEKTGNPERRRKRTARGQNPFDWGGEKTYTVYVVCAVWFISLL